MTLSVTEEKKISDLQADFNVLYPFLKLEFFQGKDNRNQPVRQIQSSAKLGDVIFAIQEGSIQLSDSMTVKELETIFNERFGIQAQVFRKSGNIWLETTMTDKWTLKNQNDHGREISSKIY